MDPVAHETVFAKRPQRAVIALVLVLATMAFATLFFIKSGDATILIFGIIASAMLFIVLARPPVLVAAVRLKCRACGRLNAEDARFCDACGKPL